MEEIVVGSCVSHDDSYEQCLLDLSVNSDGAVDYSPSARIGNTLPNTLAKTTGESFHRMGLETPAADAVQVSTVSPLVIDFVRDRFIPEYVAVKRSAGQAHFWAILKHVITPDAVTMIGGRHAGKGRSRLVHIQDWPYIGKLRLCEIDAESVQRLVSAALISGYSIQTATHIRNVVSSIFSFAARTGYYTGCNPASLVSLPTMSRKESHTLCLRQVYQLLKPMRYPERDLALFTMLADLSVAEICGLKWKYSNLTNTSQELGRDIIPPLTIAVRQQFYRGELSLAIEGRKRFLRALPPLCSLLRQVRTRKKFISPDDFVLASRRGTPIRPENIAARQLKTHGKSFGMAWLSWSVFHRTGIKLRKEMGENYNDEIGRLLAALR